MSQNFDDLRSPAAPQERQEQQTSQQPPHQQIPPLSIQQQQQQQPRPYSTWMPHASTNRFPPPRIYEFTPESSLEGDSVQVSLTLPNLELMQSLRLALGCCIMPTHSVLVNTATHFLTLSSLVPNWQLTQTSDRMRVPLFVVVCNQNQEVIDNWFVGYFAYDFARKRTSVEYDLGIGTSKRPRRTASASSASALPGEDTTAAIAAAYMVPPPPPPEQSYSGYYTLQHPPSYSNPPAPQLSPAGYQSYPSYYGMQQPSYPSPHPPHAASQPPGPPQMAPPGMGSREYFEGQTVAPTQMMNIALEPIPPTTPTPASDPRHSGIPLEPIIHAPLAASQPPAPPPHPHPPQHPQPHEHTGHLAPHAIAPAITTAPQTIAPATATATPAGGPSTASSIPPPAPTPPDPFANIPNKATLRLEGDLDSMLINWTEQECEEHRRVVQFWRRQEGNEVICSFAPVSDPEARRQEHNILVSCIYWQERGDYFITSVDCISLLEALIGVKFTVEEKNRIRRNLEGFRPLTVSKLKPDSTEFFKLIMGFSNPKPRNIEKDVKVFPWTKLGEALRKIISKYTASYSSTAAINVDNPPLPPPSQQQQ